MSHAHLRENVDAADVALCDAEIAAIDSAFHPPSKKTSLAMV